MNFDGTELIQTSFLLQNTKVLVYITSTCIIILNPLYLNYDYSRHEYWYH